MELQYEVATAKHVDLAFSFSEKRFNSGSNEMEKMMAMWKVAWRKEALAHYFNTGWSFVALQGGELVGYFMAQPFIHFRGQTQTVWVEHLEGADDQIQKSLIEIAIKVAREKHMQRILFQEELEASLSAWNPQLVDDKIFEVKTTKG